MSTRTVALTGLLFLAIGSFGTMSCSSNPATTRDAQGGRDSNTGCPTLGTCSPSAQCAAQTGVPTCSCGQCVPETAGGVQYFCANCNEVQADVRADLGFPTNGHCPTVGRCSPTSECQARTAIPTCSCGQCVLDEHSGQTYCDTPNSACGDGGLPDLGTDAGTPDAATPDAGVNDGSIDASPDATPVDASIDASIG